MNAIIYPIMPSITKTEGFVISFNNTPEMIQFSRLELQLQYRYQRAIQIQKTEEMLNMQRIQQQTVLQTHEQIENFTYQSLANIDFQNTEIQNFQEEPSKCPTPTFEDIAIIKREPFQEKLNTSVKKRKTNIQLFSFQKENQQNKDKMKRINYPQQEFKVTIPISGQSFQTNFKNLGFQQLQKWTVADFLERILNYLTKSIKIYQCNSSLVDFELERTTYLSEIIILPNTEFKIIDICSEIVKGIDIVEFEHGKIEFQAKKNVEYKKFCQFTQDCVEIEEEILKFVNRITFYNFGASSQSALNMKKLNNKKFIEYVKCWCSKNNFDILYIGTHLTVRLL